MRLPEFPCDGASTVEMFAGRCRREQKQENHVDGLTIGSIEVD